MKLKSTTELISKSAIALTMLVLMGVLVHDTRFDKAFRLAFPGATVALGMASAMHPSDGAHTHVERVHLNHAFANQPRIQPREDMRKYFSARNINQNDDFFGGARVIWPST